MIGDESDDDVQDTDHHRRGGINLAHYGVKFLAQFHRHFMELVLCLINLRLGRVVEDVELVDR